MKCCINGMNFSRPPLLLTELFKFEIQKCGQILCAHKPYFLMPGHTYIYIYIYISLSTIVLNSRDWSEIVWLPKISRFKINLAIGFIRKNPLECIG